jgi:branched-subunit amino acid aminotransferase/4-amino-4-deoxychorismate lyase
VTAPLQAWLDGRLVPADACTIAADDPGFLWGDGVFETMLIRDGRPVALDLHLARLAASLDALDLPRPPFDLAAAVTSLAHTAPAAEHVLRLTVTARPTVLAQLRPLGERGLLRRQGLDLWTLDEVRGDTRLARHKSMAYAAQRVAARLHPAGRSPTFEGLWLDAAGFALEGTATNLFAVFAGPDGTSVMTAPTSAPILPGTARARALACLQRMASDSQHLATDGDARVAAPITVLERAPHRDQLRLASELFATSATLPVAPVRHLDGAPVGPQNDEGPVTRALRIALSRD